MRGSDFYGIQNVFNRYAGLPSIDVFPYAVQHGWQPKATGYETSIKPLEIWVWSERSKENLSAYYPSEKIRITGSPYLYLKNNDSSGSGKKKKGAVFLLPHSTHHVKAVFSYNDLCDLINYYKKDFDTVDVLAYYLDVNEQLCNKVKSVGSIVLINGGIWSGDFLHVFKKNILKYKTLLFSEPGSATLFAGYEGLELIHVNLDFKYNNDSDRFVGQNLAPHYELAANFGNPDYIRKELGVEYKLKCGEVRNMIFAGLLKSNWKSLFAFRREFKVAQKKDYDENVLPTLKLLSAFQN